MNRFTHLFTCLVFLIGAETSFSQTVFHYRGFQGAGKRLPEVPDDGGAGNKGTADDALKYNSDIPTVGVPTSAGNRSFDSLGEGGILSGGTDELSNSLIAGAGGFSMETWFLWNGGGAVNALLDYAGTEKLVLDTGVATNEVRMRINSDNRLDSTIGSVAAGEWHYVAAVFDTQGNDVTNDTIRGIFRLYLDGNLVNTTGALTISDFGDSLDRGIGVGKHPLNFEADVFDGLIFEPRVSLGALSRDELLYVVPEPTSPSLIFMSLLFAAVGCRWTKPALST